jgi:hypothetical protein
MNANFKTFCQQAYKKPNAKQTLDHLSSTHQWCPNLVLAIVWHITNNRGRLSQTQLKQLQNTVQTWHDRITLPLDRLMRITNTIMLDMENLIEYNLLYELQMIESQFPEFKPNNKSSTALLNDLCHNLLIYSKLKQTSLNFHDINVLKKLLHSLLPKHLLAEIDDACEHHITTYYVKQPLTFEQLILEEL